MILILFLSLAVITWQITRQLDLPDSPPAPLSGACPGCAGRVEAGWLACPHCRAVLRRTCAACGRIHDDWVNHCPWCGQTNRGMEK